MKKSRFTKEQITFALRQAGAGMPVTGVGRGIGISEATTNTFCGWRSKEFLRPATTRDCAVDPRAIQGKQQAFLSAGTAAPIDVLLPFAGTRSNGAAHTLSRAAHSRPTLAASASTS